MHVAISKCHSLRLIAIDKLRRFARIRSRVIMLALGESVDAEAIPGTIQVATSTEDGQVKTQITFERSIVSSSSADELENLKATRLIATYVDETAQTRVAGSPDWPLSLDFVIEDGVFNVTLEGTDTKTHGFLVD